MGQRYSANKNLGQHFLQDMDIITKIVRYVDISASEHLLEIGPGPGAITQHIAQKYRFFDAIELDARFYELLSKKYQAIQNINIHNANILDFNLADIFRDIKFNIVGNLPYNIGSQIIFHLVTYKKLIDKMLFMLQKEVVNNIVAKVGSEHYGRSSIMVQYHFRTTYLFDIPPCSFTPAPAVNSSMIQLVPYNIEQPARDYQKFSLLVKTAFNNRRKTLYNNLKQLITQEQWQELADKINLDNALRPDHISVQDYVYISNYV
jgi:16S rRNA (adenine1518-N6/adenine1519-N6)-dimethyltransferase